jgi:hypothetical protein
VRLACTAAQPSWPSGIKLFSNNVQKSSVEITNISSNAAGYNSISIKSKISPDQADCHIISVKYIESPWLGGVM